MLAVTLAGGPPGNFMALGLVGALAPCFWETTSRAWKISAAAGAALIVAVSVLLLFLIPTVPQHAAFISNSLTTTLVATAKESVCWLGEPVLAVLWPWAFLVVLLPSLWVAGRVVRDLLRWRQGGQGRAGEWIDLGLIWLAAFLVVVAIAYGRARLVLWGSRYAVLAMPIGLVLYLLLVRMRAPRAIPHTLAMLMAVCCGWCWPSILAQEKAHRDRTTELVRTLTQGDVPLSELCGRYCAAVGLYASWDVYTPLLTNWMMQLRQSDQSLFYAINRRKRRAGVALPQAWKADAGLLSGGWEVVPDSKAIQGRTLRVNTAGEQPAMAAFRVQVAVGGAYRLCCRMRAPQENTLTVVVDGRQIQGQTFPATADFQPCMLSAPLKLEPGPHDLTLALSHTGSDLDMVELLPQPSANER